MKLFKGTRDSKGCKVTVTNGEGKTYDLPPRIDVKTYTEDGSYDWNYRGGGPSQLSLAIIIEVVGDAEYALKMHAQLRDMLISRLTVEGWEITEPQLREFF
jgi:hypothetical protein